MITRGLDGAFYEIPEDKAEEYKVSTEEAQTRLGQGGGGLPNAPMGMGQEMMGANVNGGSPQGVVINVFNPTAVQNPMMGQQQGPQPLIQKNMAEGGKGLEAGAQPGATCYSCYSCYCYSCYCYSCYCYRTCYSCYLQPV